jgi:hypothetical protein
MLKTGVEISTPVKIETGELAKKTQNLLFPLEVVARTHYVI